MSDILAAVAAHADRRAGFTEHRRLAALADPQTSSGTLAYDRGGRLEKRTDQPEPETLVLDHDRLVITQGSDAPRIVDLAGQPGLRALIDAVRAPLAGDARTLNDDYDIRAEGNLAAWRLGLTPRGAETAHLLHDVAIEGADGDIRRIVIRQANGDMDDLSLRPLP